MTDRIAHFRFFEQWSSATLCSDCAQSDDDRAYLTVKAALLHSLRRACFWAAPESLSRAAQ